MFVLKVIIKYVILVISLEFQSQHENDKDELEKSLSKLEKGMNVDYNNNL